MSHAEQIKKSRDNRPIPSSEAMAAWLFDHGYGHVDEPRFNLCFTTFYASDFLPENTQRLDRKLEDAQLFYGAVCRHLEQGNGDSFVEFAIKQLGCLDTKNPSISPEKLSAFKSKRIQLTGDGNRSFDQASWEIVGSLLQQMQKGYIPFFKDDVPLRAKETVDSDRVYFTLSMKKLHPDALEFAVRNKTPIHLNAYFDDELGDTLLIDDKKEGKLERGSAKIVLSDGQFNTATTVGGVSDSQAWMHSFYHELGHTIFTPSSLQPLSLAEEEKENLQQILNDTLTHLPSSHTPLHFTELCASVSVQNMANFSSKYNLHYFLKPAFDYLPGKHANEAYCDMLALSFGALEGSQGEEKIREHYKDHPEFAEAVIRLRDTVRGIFDQRLETLRAKNPLPESLCSATIVK